MFLRYNFAAATAFAMLMLAGQSASAESTTEESERFKSSVQYNDFRTAQSSYQLRASDLVGAEVINANDEEIGEVDDLVLDRDSNTVLAVISVGGFLGIGDKLVTVPYEELRLSEDGDEVFLSATRESLESQEEFRYLDGELIGMDKMSARTHHTEMESGWDKVESGWADLKNSVKEQWSELTDDDVNEINGDRDKLVDRVGERYEIEPEQAERQVDEWHANSASN